MTAPPISLSSGGEFPRAPGFYGLGMAFYFATQGLGSVIWTVTANVVRLVVNTACALAAIYWLDLAATGFFIAIAGGFCTYAALAAASMFRVKELLASPHGEGMPSQGHN